MNVLVQLLSRVLTQVHAITEVAVDVLVQLSSRVLINTSTCCECLGAAAFTCVD